MRYSCMKLLLVRHGETVDNKRHICQGQLPGELNDNGRLQAKTLAEALARKPIDICYTSDLRRARQTCDIITSPFANLTVIEDHRLRERNFGILQGTVMTDSWNGFGPMQGAEPMEALYERLQNFMASLTDNHDKQTILIVSHGITLLALTAVCLGYTLSQIDRLALPANCSVSQLEKTNGKLFTITDQITVGSGSLHAPTG